MSPYTISIHNSVTSIQPKIWDQLGCSDTIYFSPEFLEAYEVSNPKVTFKYILVIEDQSAIAIANIQVIDLSMDAIFKNIKISNFLKKSITFFFRKNSLRILFCGNIFLSGEHGIYLKKGVDKKVVFNAISKAIKTLSRSKEVKPLHAVFVKDFYRESLHITDELLNYDYSAMPVEPNMILTLDPQWTTFEAYKNDLKSKYRVKVNKADSTSQVLTSKLFTGEDFARYKDDLQQLYENTIENANFNAQVLNLNTYINLRRLYRERFIVMAYFYEDQLVGFLSALVTNNHLDAHFIGLDYTLNKKLAIYPRILNDYVRLGIEKGVSQINFGRTASEIKSTIGAKPEHLMCYIRHKNNVLNQLVKPFFKKVKLKDFKQHHPFKN